MMLRWWMLCFQVQLLLPLPPLLQVEAGTVRSVLSLESVSERELMPSGERI